MSGFLLPRSNPRFPLNLPCAVQSATKCRLGDSQSCRRWQTQIIVSPECGGKGWRWLGVESGGGLKHR
jgi:hypothetical protein